MDNINQFIESLGLENMFTLEEIPKIDLYMDQVIQLFENKYAVTKRNKKDKVLTKTMINNYAKGKLFFPIKNKKYSREHLLLISLIYQLKGGLSISDIKETLDGINEKIVAGEFSLDSFYTSYLHLITSNVEDFKEDMEVLSKRVGDEQKDELENNSTKNLQQILMITSLIHVSNIYRRAAEKLVDEISQEKEEKG